MQGGFSMYFGMIFFNGKEVGRCGRYGELNEARRDLKRCCSAIGATLIGLLSEFDPDAQIRYAILRETPCSENVLEEAHVFEFIIRKNGDYELREREYDAAEEEGIF